MDRVGFGCVLQHLLNSLAPRRCSSNLKIIILKRIMHRIVMFVVVINFDALTQASFVQIKQRQVDLLC